jgi:hypothetical protein
MPKWGLNDTMRRTKPWGLAEHWLQPGKVITGPVHGDIYMTKLEVAMLERPPFQRLRKVRQLGLQKADFNHATMTEPRLTGAHLRGVTGADLREAMMDDRTICPDGSHGDCG